MLEGRSIELGKTDAYSGTDVPFPAPCAFGSPGTLVRAYCFTGCRTNKRAWQRGLKKSEIEGSVSVQTSCGAESREGSKHFVRGQKQQQRQGKAGCTSTTSLKGCSAGASRARAFPARALARGGSGADRCALAVPSVPSCRAARGAGVATGAFGRGFARRLLGRVSLRLGGQGAGAAHARGGGPPAGAPPRQLALLACQGSRMGQKRAAWAVCCRQQCGAERRQMALLARCAVNPGTLPSCARAVAIKLCGTAAHPDQACRSHSGAPAL